MEETYTGIVKWHYYSKSYVIDTGKSPRNIQLSDILKNFNGKQVKVSITSMKLLFSVKMKKQEEE